MRHALPLLALTCTSALMLGCQGGSPVAPADSVADGGNAGLGQTLVSDAAKLGALGLYDVSLDPDSLQATVTLRESRHAQDNDDVYLLGIDGFLRPDSFRIRSITRRPSEFEIGTQIPRLDLQWEFTHPFRSSATLPRADLGFSGIACFLFDVDTAVGHSYFVGAGDVILNESIVQRPDGFYQPRALLDLPGMTANTFPFQSLVNEIGADLSGGNRFDSATGEHVSNGGNLRGNFGADGWQTGTTETWTGYDVLHQGQSAYRILSLDLAALEAAGSIDFTVAIFDKYVDPKSATPGFEHRLPADPPDILGDFGYRYPHGCWDVSHVEFMGETRGFVTGKESATTVRYRIRDWDARATSSAEVALSDEPDPSKILPSGVGSPTLRACVPAAFGGPAGIAPLGDTPNDNDLIFGASGDPEPETGLPLDELFYERSIYAPTGINPAAGNRIWGVLEVADPELTNPAYQTPLDGELQPLTANLPQNATYQVFSMVVQPQSTATGWAASGHGAGDSYATAVTYDNLGNVFVGGNFFGDIILGGTTYTSAGNSDCFIAKYDAAGVFQWAEIRGGTGADEITCLYVSEDSPLTLLVGGTFSSTVNFNPPAGSPRTAQFIDMFVMQLLTTNGSFATVRTFGSTGMDVITSIADNGNRPEGDYFIGGYIMGTVDFGGGHVLSPMASLEGFVAGMDRITGNAKSACSIMSTATGYSNVTYIDMFEDGTVAAVGVFTEALVGPSGDVPVEGGIDGYIARLAMSSIPDNSELNYVEALGGFEDDNVGGLVALGSGVNASVLVALNSRTPGSGDYRSVVGHQVLDGGPALGFELIGGTSYFQIKSLARKPGSTLTDGTYYACGYKAGLMYFFTSFPAEPIILPGSGDGSTHDMFVWSFSAPTPDTRFFRTNWVREMGGDGTEYGLAMAAGPIGTDALAIAGQYGSDFDIAPGPPTANLPVVGGTEAFVTQLPADGSW